MRDIKRRGSLRGWLPYCLYMDVKARSNMTSCNTVIRLSSRRRSRCECNSRLVYMCKSCVRNASVRPRAPIVPRASPYHSRELSLVWKMKVMRRYRNKMAGRLGKWECLVLSHSDLAATISCQICRIYLEQPCCITRNSFHVRCTELYPLNYYYIISIELY